MNTNHRLLTAAGLLAAPALLSALPVRDRIAFAPTAGASVSMTYTMVSENSLDDMSMSMNGQEMPMEMEMEMANTMEVSFTDEIQKVDGASPTAFKRTFNTILSEVSTEMAMDMMGQGQDETVGGRGTSPLEGKTVAFAWKDGEYAVSWADDEEGDASLLEDHDAHAWLAGLLPGEEVSEGGSWDIDTSALLGIFAPCGDLHLEIEMDGGDAGMSMGPDAELFTNLRQLMDGALEGSFTGKLTGYRDVDDVRMAVIELELEIDSVSDLSDMIRESMEESLPPEMPIEMDIGAVDVNLTLEAKGELLWNAAAGVPGGLSLEGEMGVSMDMSMSMDAGGQQMDMENYMEMSGSIQQTVTVD